MFCMFRLACYYNLYVYCTILEAMVNGYIIIIHFCSIVGACVARQLTLCFSELKISIFQEKPPQPLHAVYGQTPLLIWPHWLSRTCRFLVVMVTLP